MAAPADPHRGAEAALLLEKLPLHRAEKLLNELGATLSGKQQKGPQPNQYAELSASDFHKVTQAVSELFRAYFVAEGSNYVNFVNHSNLSSPYKEKIRQFLLRHENDLRAHLQRLSTIPKKVLTNFDWQALVVAASSHLSSQETPILRLCLCLESYSGVPDHSRTSVELSVSELDTTINELQSCLDACTVER